MTSVARFILVQTIAVALAGAARAEGAYRVEARYPLTSRANGLDGLLVLETDARLRGATWGSIWGKGPWLESLAPESDAYREFSVAPPRNAVLSLRGADGKVISQRVLSVPLAKLETWSGAAPGKALFLLIEDRSSSAGSYSGPVTSIISVSNGRMAEVEARDEKSQAVEPIRLLQSLKSTWRILPKSQGQVILAVTSRLGQDGKFETEHIRYSARGGVWTKRTRVAPGVWESGDAFPPTSSFP